MACFMDKVSYIRHRLRSLQRTNAQEDNAVVEVYESPWRRINWQKPEIEEELINFSVSNLQIKHLRLLMYRPVGAGKSSFVNSVDSAFQNRVSSKAIMGTASDTSYTKAYKCYKIKNGLSGTLPFIFCDIMGVESGKDDGVHPGDVNNALRGHLPDGYMLNSQNSWTPKDPVNMSKPSMGEKIHCLVCVVSGSTISQLSSRIIKKIKHGCKEATKLGILQIVIMSMIYEVCPLVNRDLKNVYLSKTIKKKMQECSDRLSIPMTCIFPVKNYHEETETSDDMDVLLLLALKQIAHFASDCTEEL